MAEISFVAALTVGPGQHLQTVGLKRVERRDIRARRSFILFRPFLDLVVNIFDESLNLSRL